MQKFSRRSFGNCLLTFLLCRLPLRGQANPAAPPGRLGVRTYRADAVILFLGMSVYRREGVGSGKASIEETGDGDALRRTLFFAAGSDPARARGLSRLGWMREVVAGPASCPSDISYLGVLTSSPEETLDHAKKSVGDSASQRSVFSAVNGRNTAGRSRSAIAHFEFPSTVPWSDQGLINQARSVFQGKVNWRETAWPNLPEQAPPTFLTQLATLLAQRSRRSSGRYVYNEQEYLLEIEPQDGSRGADRLLPVKGQIKNLRTGQNTRFRVWLDDRSELPVRFEFQARSFLKLTFTAVAA